jgi:hypothetical protein
VPVDAAEAGVDSGASADAADAAWLPEVGSDAASGPDAPADARSEDAALDGSAADADGRLDSATDALDGEPDGSVLPDGTCQAPLPLGTVTDGGTTGFPNVIASTCASVHGSGTEVVYAGSATADGRFEVELSSAADLGISVRRTCDSAASEMACQDLVPGGQERISVPIVHGETLFFVVEGWNAARAGAFSLSSVFVEASCSDGVLDGNELCDDGNGDDGDGCTACTLDACIAPLALDSVGNGDTTTSDSAIHSACANAISGREDVYSWTAPVAGTYRFTLSPSGSADMVLGLRATCAEVAGETCVDEGFGGDPESVLASLAEGETVFILVDGWGSADAGPYTLEVGAVD